MLGFTAFVGGFVAWACATFVTDEVLTVSEVFIFSTVLTGVAWSARPAWPLASSRR